jgi:ElaB/YqjD/DUF883 family membrane-anchored ribosome-binding protein
MTTHHSADKANTLADHAASRAAEAIDATQRVANETLDHLAETVQAMRDTAADFLSPAADMAGRGADAIRYRSLHLRDQARHASAQTVHYIRSEPLKSVLIAAATGAVVAAVFGLLTRRSDRD